MASVQGALKLEIIAGLSRLQQCRCAVLQHCRRLVRFSHQPARARAIGEILPAHPSFSAPYPLRRTSPVGSPGGVDMLDVQSCQGT